MEISKTRPRDCAVGIKKKILLALAVLAAGVLAAVLLTAVCTDVRFRRIPNWLTVSAAAVGLVLSVFGLGIGSSLKGLLYRIHKVRKIYFHLLNQLADQTVLYRQ